MGLRSLIVAVVTWSSRDWRVGCADYKLRVYSLESRALVFRFLPIHID